MSEPVLAPTDVPAPVSARAGARLIWAERLARFAGSGLSPAQFCAQEGVSLPSFYSWRRRLTAPADAPDARPASDTPVGPRLLPVRLAPPAAPVELVLPGGAVLRLFPGCDLTFVRSLVGALGETPC